MHISTVGYILMHRMWLLCKLSLERPVIDAPKVVRVVFGSIRSILLSNIGSSDEDVLLDLGPFNRNQ